MGRSIDLYSYDCEKLINKLQDVCNTNDRELIEKVLLCCGEKISDRYVILNQEFWDGCSCYYNVTRVLERIFNVEDVFGKVFCTLKDGETDEQELISAIELDDIFQELKINVDDEYEQHE
jgi:hypothetical protein